MNTDKNERQENQRLPDDVHNGAQDPASMRDPLQQQLERSEGQNGAQEQDMLKKLRDQYGTDGTGRKE